MENQALKEAFKALPAEIIRKVNPGHVMDVLLSKNIISDDDYHELLRIPHNLFALLHRSSHPETFIHLREALHDEYPWIVEKIDEQLTTQTAQLQQLHLEHYIDGNFLLALCNFINWSIKQ